MLSTFSNARSDPANDSITQILSYQLYLAARDDFFFRPLTG